MLRRSKILISIMGAIIFILLGLSAFLFINSKQSNSPDATNPSVTIENNSLLKEDSVFGSLNSDDFYKDIRVDTIAYISDDMIAHIIRNVTNALSRSDGTLSFKYKREGRTVLYLKMIWRDENSVLEETAQYKIQIAKFN